MTKNEVAKLEGPKIENPYALATESAKSQGPNNSVTQAQQQRAMIEVMTSFEVAKRFPRQAANCADKILDECARPTLAEVAVYSYAKGGQQIEGPTIRLMEAIARAWGNIRFGWDVLQSTKKESTIRAYAFDLENNILRELSFDVRHWRDTKSGGYPITEERDIYELQANMAMRRVRSCLQGLIPGDVIDMALAKCDETMRNAVDVSPAGIKKVLQTMEGVGVNKAMIEAKFQGLKVEAMRAPQIVILRKIYTALKDGVGNIEDSFDIELADKKKAKAAGPNLAAEIEKTNAKDAEKVPVEAKSEPEKPIDDGKTYFEEPKDDLPKESSLFQKCKEALETAKDVDDLYNIWAVDWVADVKKIPPADRKALDELYKSMSRKFTTPE